jgi:hypothetical protein
MAAKDEAERSARRAEAPLTSSQVVSAQTAATSPAPPLVESETTTDVPSARPTSVPDHHVMTIERGTFSFEAHTNVPLAIPRRVPGAGASVLSHEVACVLMHVDGVSTVATIAEVADQPLEDVVMCFRELVALGIVSLAEPKQLESMPPDSRIHRRPR